MKINFRPIADKVRSFFFRPINEKEHMEIIQKEKSPALLDLIGEKESRGNYNAYFGKADNQALDFTKMTVSEVRKWQDDFVNKGSKSSAVGKYQIIRKTLDSLIKEMGLTGKERFDQKLQDQMAVTLLNRRGYDKFKAGKIDRNTFANNLAKEWASFPVVTPINGKRPGQSYYAGDGLNKALIAPESVFAALDKEVNGDRVVG